MGPASDERILPPRLRIVEAVAQGLVRPDEIVHVQVEMKHPNRTGLVLRGGAFVRDSEPLYLQELEVWYGDERVSRFTFTPALSDDPLVGFCLRASREAPLRVRVRNNRGARFEAEIPIRLA